MFRIAFLVCCLIGGTTFANSADAGDWPMWRYDAGRTASSPSELPAKLHALWTKKFSPRQPVWDDPLNQDLMPYDEIFEPVVAGKTMYMGFNDSDKLLALDTTTGRERWRFYTEGPVRLPPVVAEGRVHFVSDDGYLYTLNAVTGELLWKYRGGPSDRRILGNERLISTWPARGAPVVRDGDVYFAASIWPFMGTFIYALNAETGDVRWINDGTGSQYLDQPHNYPAFAGIAPQGPLVATQNQLLIPGGRSIPACFDRQTGEFQYFHLAKYGKSGGSSVFANDKVFFGHERAGEFSLFHIGSGMHGNGVRGMQPVLSGNEFFFSGEAVSRRTFENPTQETWKFEVDATHDLIQAGNRLYAAGAQGITALELPADGGAPTVAWTIDVAESAVKRLLAADDKLFAVTADGHILAFGAGDSAQTADAQSVDTDTSAAITIAPEAMQQARQIIADTGVSSGYAMFYGVGDGQLLAALAKLSELSIIAVDADPANVAKLRERFDNAGLYGRRVSIFTSDLPTFNAPPYFSSLTIVHDAAQVGYQGDSAALAQIFSSLRPYGGIAVLPDQAERVTVLQAAANSAKLANAQVAVAADRVTLTRAGALPGSGVWTHQYGNIANTIKSDDQLVKLPLGMLWFGGSSNMDVLPRHGHGPPEQVIGGRLFIEGMDLLSARDVYTGRVLWQTKLENVNSFGVYYDETYKNTPLSVTYNQVHIPGANARGTNFVATTDRVYVIQANQVRMLDAANGNTLKMISLPSSSSGKPPESWGYIGVEGDYLIGGAGFSNYSRKLDIPVDQSESSKSRWRFVDYDKTASDGLVVMDRHTGEVKWKAEAVHGFVHNSVIVAHENLYCLDKVPPNLEQRLARRGQARPETYRLVAFDLHTGDVKWETSENVFGTWLSCSAERGIVLQSTRPSNDTVRDEDGKRMIAYEAATGDVIWDREIRYRTPPILHGDSIITGGKKYDLLTGDVHFRLDPLTGIRNEWTYVSTKGCNYPIASENLITFRSSAAAFYDLVDDGGTGHFGGFKSGCTSNLVAADGVLNAPDYTRTCRCSFQNQTSLALIHMPELEIWTHNDFGYNGKRVRQVGINFGAPGDRRAENGTLWLDYPSVGGPSPNVGVVVDGPAQYFRRHSSLISSGETPWVSASGVEGVTSITVRIVPESQKADEGAIVVAIKDGDDDVEEQPNGQIDFSSSDLELSQDGNEVQQIGIRFQKVPVERNAKIKRAYVQFQTDETSAIPTELEIAGEAADNAAAYASKKFDVSSRSKTQARVAWKPAPWNKTSVASADQQSPDLAPVIQEIINRRGWKPNQSLALTITGKGKRTAESFEGDPKGAAKLKIILEEPSSTTPAETVEPAAPETHLYTVRLHFLEPNADMTTGQRVFDVALQGQTVLKGLDVAAEADGNQRELVREFTNVVIGDELAVKLTPTTGKPAVICGIEVIAVEK